MKSLYVKTEESPQIQPLIHSLYTLENIQIIFTRIPSPIKILDYNIVNNSEKKVIHVLLNGILVSTRDLKD